MARKYSMAVADLVEGAAITQFDGDYACLAIDYPHPMPFAAPDLYFASIAHILIYEQLRMYGLMLINKKLKMFKLGVDGITSIRTAKQYNELSYADLRATMWKVREAFDIDLSDELRFEKARRKLLNNLVQQRFASDKAARKVLLATGKQTLVYGNLGYDRVMGATAIGYHYTGDNLYGNALMKQRKALRKGKA